MRKWFFLVFLCIAAGEVIAQQANDVGITPLPSRSTAAVSPATLVGSGSFDGTEATMSPRFFRSGNPGDPCSLFSAGNFQYLAYPFTTDASGSLTATFDPGACGTALYVTFHTAPFDPASICTGYVWAYGSSTTFSETFTVTPSTAMEMVVSGASLAPGVACGPYSFAIDGTATVPTMTEWALIALIALLAALGGWRLAVRRRTIGEV